MQFCCWCSYTSSSLIQRCHCWYMRAHYLGFEVGSNTNTPDPQRERCYSWWQVCSHPLLMALLVGFLWLYRVDKIKIGRDHSMLCNLHPQKVKSILFVLPLGNPQLIHRYLQNLRMYHLENRRLLWGQSRHDFALNFRTVWLLIG